MNSFLESKRFIYTASYLGLFLVSVGISWAIFSFVIGGQGAAGSSLSGLASKRDKIAELPKTEECPINGQLFSKPEREIWEGRRPITAMIENNIDARPLSGLSRADVVYEAVAEGGITRFLGVFYCGAAGVDLRAAVVRSARVHFINWAAEYGSNPIFLHWGGANNFCRECVGGVKPVGDIAPEVNAYTLLDTLGWRNGQSGNDFDGQSNIGYPIVIREESRLGVIETEAEHTPVVYIDRAYAEADKRGFNYKDSKGKAWDKEFESWKFKDEKPSGSPVATKIDVQFWENKPDYDVVWEYDVNKNAYKRFNGGSPFVDWEFESAQIEAKNVVVMFVNERGPVDRELHLLYKTVDTGEAWVFQNGEAIEGTWEKDGLTSRTKFFDENGREIEFVRGPIWIEGVPHFSDSVYN